MEADILRAKVASAVNKQTPWPYSGPVLNCCNELPIICSFLQYEATGEHILHNVVAWMAAAHSPDYYLSFKVGRVDVNYGYGPDAKIWFDLFGVPF